MWGIEFFMLGIIFLGITTTYTDYKTHKILNNHIIWALIYAAIIHLILYFRIDTNVQTAMIYLTTSAILSFILWYLGYWGAGDGKLFIVYTALIPASIYPSHNEYGWIYLLAAMFASAFIYYAIKEMIRSFRRPRRAIRDLIGYAKEKLPAAILGIFSISWALDSIARQTGFKLSFIINFIIISIIYAGIRYIFKDKTRYLIYAYGAITTIRLIMNHESINSDALLGLLRYLIFFMIIGFTITGTQPKKVRIDQLEEGMILAETIYKDREGYKKSQLNHFIKKESVIEYVRNKLDTNDIKKLRKLYKTKGFPFRHLKVRKTQIFAPFMFLGAIITIMGLA